MRYTETGFNLEIDLTRGSVERVATDPRDTELYLGGLGTSAKILWDRVPPEVEPFSRKSSNIQRRSLVWHSCCRLQSHHCFHGFAANFVNGVFDDGWFLGARIEVCRL